MWVASLLLGGPDGWQGWQRRSTADSVTCPIAYCCHLRLAVPPQQTHSPPAGFASLGVGLLDGPFSWLNQGCWLGYAATVAASVALVSWELVLEPTAELRRADRQLALWGLHDSGAGSDASARGSGRVQAAAGLGEGGQPQALLIKARRRSQEGESVAAAQAAARRLSAAP